MWPIYFLHFSGVTVFQNSLIPSSSSSFVLGFTLHMVLKFMPHILNGIQIWTLRGSFPPRDAVVFYCLSSQVACVFWVVILHETMCVEKCFIYKWKESLIENTLSKVYALHYSSEN